MSEDRQQDTSTRAVTPRRRLLTAAALVPLLAGAGASAACAGTPRRTGPHHPDRDQPDHQEGPHRLGHPDPLRPAPTKAADWSDVLKALGLPGSMVRDEYLHARAPRNDLHVVSYDVKVTSGLALGSHVAFVRYEDGSTLAMGDLTVTEGELQQVSDTLQARGIAQTALHKHLLAHSPDVWWIHVHAHGHDAVAIARGVRAALDRTGTPPVKPGRPPAKPPIDLDTRRLDATLGTKGSNDGGLYKAVFHRRETVIDNGMLMPQGLGASTAFNFQPLGGGKAAINGDFVMVAEEVQKVLKALRRGGISLVELHNHGLAEEPRLFFTHFWAVGDALELAKALRSALDVTNVVPGGGGGGGDA
nr:DUF1259 domain-containing protein [Streptomyces sp. NBC_00857]